MTEGLNATLTQLIGSEYRGSSRIGGMEMFVFGPDIAWRSEGAEETSRPRFEWHLQCPWRISVRGEICVGSGDGSSDIDAGDPWTARDAELHRHFPPDPRRTIVSATASPKGDLAVAFSDGSILECFVDSSNANEEAYWLGDFRDAGAFVMGRGIVDIVNS